MDKLKMHTPDLTQDNIARIRELFPGCVTEAKGNDGSVRLAVDFDQLRQELSGSIVEGPQERYHLNWPGKREALLTANAPIAKTLRPCHEESVEFDTTKNLFIEGDNLDALKLLQETYLGKVKMIYIDPPYNTGNDFIYEDDFSEDSESFLQRSNQKDELGNKLIVNTEANGRFHSDWLSMIYSRLRLARGILADDGAIFISIDDGEQSNLKKACDEVFGEENFIANIIWQKKFAPQNDAKYLSSSHDHILLYSKSKPSFRVNLLPRSDKAVSRYVNKDNDPRGPWASSDLLRMEHRDNCVYEIVGPTGKRWKPAPGTSWRHPEKEMLELISDNQVWFGEDGESKPRRKRFLSDVKDGVTPETIWLHEAVGHNQEGTKAVKELFSDQGVEFSNPKPVRLLMQMLRIATSKNDLVLDFFAGSSTTAHAVMQLNAEDGGSRKFVMVQIPEPCNEKSEAFKIGYKSIAEISKERIRRAGKSLIKSDPNEAHKLDIGFRVLRVDSSNMADVYYTPDALDKGNLNLFVDNIKADRTAEDLLFQVMLDWGVDLALPISKQAIQGKDVFFVDGNALVACFDAHGGIDEGFVKELAKQQPLRVIFRDAGFKDSAVKINVEQIFKSLSPSTEVKCI